MRGGDVDLGVGVLASPAIARRSAPEEKLPPAPVRMMRADVVVGEASTIASYIRTSIAPESAL